MYEVACHQIAEQRVDEALVDIEGRAYGHWHSLRYGSLRLARVQRMRDELLDHVAARILTEPASVSDPLTRGALRTAAEAAYGVLDLGTFPGGDFLVAFTLCDESLSSEDFAFADAVDLAPTASTWKDAFATGLIGGLLDDRERMIGPMLEDDIAPQIREGVPCSPLESVSDPAALGEMDALCTYLVPEVRQPGPLRMPAAEERTRAARRLDAAADPTPDQRLLRVLLEDDRPAFDKALADRLVQHRDTMAAEADPHPRTLLPVGTIALAALAVRVHGWQLGVRSGYLPEALLRG
ncbi:immunity 49 family protein [Streptomyces sp. NPDC004111]|uniref:immunity 49 family protein n=1 Tax=Streptomyces sp. NPDC004111 TaxID=3364690 RepID=UPI0036B999B1